MKAKGQAKDKSMDHPRDFRRLWQALSRSTDVITLVVAVAVVINVVVADSVFAQTQPQAQAPTQTPQPTAPETVQFTVPDQTPSTPAALPAPGTPAAPSSNQTGAEVAPAAPGSVPTATPAPLPVRPQGVQTQPLPAPPADAAVAPTPDVQPTTPAGTGAPTLAAPAPAPAPAPAGAVPPGSQPASAPAMTPAPAIAAPPIKLKTPEQIEAENFASQIVRVRSLLDQGAAGLAAELVEVRQGEPDNIKHWLQWERLRLEAYALLDRDRDIVNRVSNVPVQVPDEARRDFEAFGAAAQLELGETAQARATLRRLLWSGAVVTGKEAEWRRHILRSYAIEKRYDDARSSALRYQIEFQPADAAWINLQARILLLAEDYESVIRILGPRKEPESRLIMAFAHLRGGTVTPGETITRVDKALASLKKKPQLLPLAWRIRAEAARLASNAPMQVASFEKLALVSDGSDDLLVDFDANRLWEAWASLGIAQANRASLLRGDDASWIKTAGGLAKKSAIAARSMYAWVIRNGSNPAAITAAHNGLATLLAEDKDGLAQIAFDIYGATGEYADSQQLTDITRVKLSDAGLASGDMLFAATMVRNILNPPGKMQPIQWALRRARISILAGEFESGASVLQDWANAADKMDPDVADRFLQPVFDLQAVDEHELALPILERIMLIVPGDRHQREITYWTAESATALGRDAQAAELYLRSADLAGPDGALWARSAQYQAAEAMATAGLTRDARVLFQGLLDLESDEARRVRIERRMQSLYLIEAQGLRDAAKAQ